MTKNYLEAPSHSSKVARLPIHVVHDLKVVFNIMNTYTKNLVPRGRYPFSYFSVLLSSKIIVFLFVCWGKLTFFAMLFVIMLVKHSLDQFVRTFQHVSRSSKSSHPYFLFIVYYVCIYSNIHLYLRKVHSK
ncbi:hypothetical protein O6H91_01G134600 [Diphasiastrum complanatum]|uniref:Uncharacterized protein n=1 Tax=Diphasiastrum complanatum TaxID=34168 RepID=A0ACC2EWS6_DIPCM|nr:hypothetical protein O6H91_Y041900 [Diphasiastrum complanatum]KAJ7570770.1 hypothetical protein O6H91_01G134600 [Diphasiastrum complanatum]